jgi:ABC-type proline/glycine betaine transport system permease subunit
MRRESDSLESPVGRRGDELLAALVHLGGTGKYISWGVVQISLANLIVIAVMIVMLVAAIMLPFPKHETRRK